MAMRAARQQIKAAQIPIEQQIASERKANLRAAQQQMGFAKAAAALTQNIAPQVQQNYSNAANADAGYSRGLGDVVQNNVNQQNDANNAFLQKVGVNTGQHTAADVGGTAYGLEGYIPATSLQREGAAFGSAAAMLPADILSAGRQSASSTINDNKNIAPLQAQLADLASKEPAVYQQILDHAVSERQAQQRLGLDAQRQQFDEFAKTQELGQSAQRIKLESASLAQRALSEDRSYRLALSRLGLESKRFQLEATKSELALRNGGFSHHEVQQYKSDAALIAGNAFTGFTDAKGVQHKPLNYKAALKEMVLGVGAHGAIPLSIAIQALHEAGYHPGVRGTPILPSPATGNGQGMFASLEEDFKKAGGSFKNVAESAAATKIVQLAHEYMGTPYVWGGESPKGFDCSGFAQYLYGKAGISIPRDTYDQFTGGRKVAQGQLRPGDLVFFKGSDAKVVNGRLLPGHVGIYIGGGKMIDAPNSGSVVRIDKVSSFGGYMGARRYGKD